MKSRISTTLSQACRNKRRSACVAAIAAIFAILLSAAPLRAQVTAAISGKVVDASGAGIGGATITVKGIETGITRTATTDNDGNYRVDSLPLGAMEVHAVKDGFSEQVGRGVDLVVGQDASVNLQLAVGVKTQQIDVVEVIPTVNISTAPISG